MTSPRLRTLELLCVIGGVAATALAYSLRTGEPLIDAKWLAAALAGAALLALYAVGWTRGARRVPPWDVALGPLVLAAGIVASCAASRPLVAGVHALPGALVPVAWAWMALTIRWSKRDLALLRDALAAIGAAVALIGLAQFYAPDAAHLILGFAQREREGRGAIISTIGNPEYLGGFLAPVAVLSIASLWRGTGAGASRRGLDFLRGAGMLLILWALLLTEARAAWIGLVLGIVVLWVGFKMVPRPPLGDPAEEKSGRNSKRRETTEAGPAASGGKWPKWTVASVALALLVLVALPTPLNPARANPFRRVAQLGDLRSDSLRQRILLYVVAARMIRTDGLLGRGPASYSRGFAPTLAAMRTPETEEAVGRIAYELGDRQPGNVHSDVLEFWAENGILGLAGFLWLIAASVVLVWRTVRQGWRANQAPARSPDRNKTRDDAASEDPAWRLLAVTFAAAWFCGALYSLFAFPFHSPDRALLFWTLYGATGAAALAAGEKRGTTFQKTAQRISTRR